MLFSRGSIQDICFESLALTAASIPKTWIFSDAIWGDFISVGVKTDCRTAVSSYQSSFNPCFSNHEFVLLESEGRMITSETSIKYTA
jgi:hypothetical protein